MNRQLAGNLRAVLSMVDTQRPFVPINHDKFAVATFLAGPDEDGGGYFGAVDYVWTRDALDVTESLFVSCLKRMEDGRYDKGPILILDRSDNTVLFARNCDEEGLREIAAMYDYKLPYPIQESFREKFFSGG